MRPRIHYTESQKALMWERWQKGESLQQIAQLFDRNHSSIQPILASKLRELRFAATAPVRNLIQQDKKAFRALAEVSELRKAALGGRSLNVYSQTFGPFPSFSLDLTPGLHVFSPPYDLDRPGPQTGSPTDSRADRDTGDIFANCPFDSNAHGFRAASASVIIIFQPSVIGTLSVRPYTKYAQSWSVDGEYLSAHSEGHLTISASRDDNGQGHRPVLQEAAGADVIGLVAGVRNRSYQHRTVEDLRRSPPSG